ncbi:MAG: glycosyltransferase [Verrucomicrobia bacterium]|nr:glycosyltransferase [Verrucomicrobiota bacterium]MCH8512709.1 glycosyltransferase [Kiritimatiellia bacterium]
MNSPTVSILLPVRNAVHTLPDAVASLRAQTFPDWELLMVNDGSTDDTDACMNAMASGDPRIQVIHQPPLGLVTALNRAAEMANAPLIARMDADDLCHPQRLERQVAALHSEPGLGVVACRIAFGGDRRRNRGYAEHVDWVNRILTPEDHRLNRFVESPVAHPSVMWRREVQQTYGVYRDGPFPEDYELWLRWMHAGVAFRKLPETLLTWNDPPDRLSRTDIRYTVQAFYEVKCDYLARILPADRPLVLWGAGRVTRRRFDTLRNTRGPFAGYVDISPAKIGRKIDGTPVLSPAEIPHNALILVGVAARGARDQIESHLRATGRLPGQDYWLCA